MRAVLSLGFVLLCACSSPRQQPQAAMPMAEQKPTVFVRGNVRNPAIPWTEDLTVARAIVAAEYNALFDPLRILVVRQGQTYEIKPRDLLRGREDFPLDPGDLIVIER
jgi:hypothetical protein